MEKTISLKEIWAEFRQKNPKVRIREAARILGVSEAELVATGVGDHVIALKNTFKDLLKEVSSLGRVMALTRNEFCVHERKGRYEQVSVNNHVGLALGPDIDLRMFMSQWKIGFAVQENDRKSLQFFNGEGTAMHKIYLTPDSDLTAYNQLVERYRSSVVPDPLVSTAWPQGAGNEPVELPASIDRTPVRDFQKGWLAIKATHDFLDLSRKYELNQ